MPCGDFGLSPASVPRRLSTIALALLSTAPFAFAADGYPSYEEFETTAYEALYAPYLTRDCSQSFQFDCSARISNPATPIEIHAFLTPSYAAGITMAFAYRLSATTGNGLLALEGWSVHSQIRLTATEGADAVPKLTYVDWQPWTPVEHTYRIPGFTPEVGEWVWLTLRYDPLLGLKFEARSEGVTHSTGWISTAIPAYDVATEQILRAQSVAGAGAVIHADTLTFV